MDRLVRAIASGIVVLIVLFIATMLVVRRHRVSPSVTSSTPAPASTPKAPVAEDTCVEAVVLTLQTHAGFTAQLSVRDLEGRELSTRDASEDEGRFTTACARNENDDPSGDPAPQVLRLCHPGVFVVHISGTGKGVFDFQAKALPEIVKPVGPLLLCNYALDGDRVYDWVLKYQRGVKPTVFLLDSKGDPNTRF